MTWDGLEGAYLPAEHRERDRPEARLERELLRALGRELPGVLAMKNEVGVGYRGALKVALERALDGYTSKAIAMEVLKRHRITYGLGVGSTDLVIVTPQSAFLGVELKTEAGRLSPEQERWHDAARAKGADIIVVRSVEQGLAEVRRRVR